MVEILNIQWWQKTPDVNVKTSAQLALIHLRHHAAVGSTGITLNPPIGISYFCQTSAPDGGRSGFGNNTLSH